MSYHKQRIQTITMSIKLEVFGERRMKKGRVRFKWKWLLQPTNEFLSILHMPKFFCLQHYHTVTEIWV